MAIDQTNDPELNANVLGNVIDPVNCPDGAAMPDITSRLPESVRDALNRPDPTNVFDDSKPRDPPRRCDVPSGPEGVNLDDESMRPDMRAADGLKPGDAPAVADAASRWDAWNEYDVLAVGEGDFETVGDGDLLIVGDGDLLIV
jgi:hypothetical protein